MHNVNTQYECTALPFDWTGIEITKVGAEGGLTKPLLRECLPACRSMVCSLQMALR